VFSSSGDPAGEMSLDTAIFGIEPNSAVMHQVVTAQLAAARSGSANTKTRAEVRGGGRKPWRQKGLGRARHGSIRSPQWRGGGVAFGPKPRDYSQRTPKKMRRLALLSALSVRAAEQQVVVIDGFDWDTPRTKSAVALIEAIDAPGKVLFVVGPSDGVVVKSVRNLPRARVITAGQLNTYDVLWAATIVFTKDTVAMAGSSPIEVSDDDFVRDEEAEAS
jgi:large subunit ribosomal protein L4